jgi:TonB family protein
MASRFGRPLRGSLALVLIACATMATSRDARAQDQPQDTGGAPRGASGAIITAPKDEPQKPAPPAPVIVMPKLVKDEGAEYPQQALVDKVKESVEVVLILELDATGHVKKATVETAAGHGFDEAAIAAAQKLEFSPATKNGTPVPAKIKHKYVFTPPLSRIVGRVTSEKDRGIAGASVTVTGADGEKHTVSTNDTGAWFIDGLAQGAYHVTAAAQNYYTRESDEEIGAGQELDLTLRLTRLSQKPTTAPGEKEMEQVEVKAERPPREAVKRTLDQREISRIPGTNGDALRSLQNLPGVARSPGLGGLLIVRGAAPQDTQVFVDGTGIPIVYHFGGLSSVVPTEALDRIDFYPGNFSSAWGRAMGGVVDVGIKDAASKDKKIHGLAQADLIDARVLASGPIANTGLDFMVAGRRSYFDTWLKPVLESTGAGVTAAPVYYDYQALVQKNFSSKENVRLMFFGSDDNLKILTNTVGASDPELGGGVGVHTGFWRVQGRYRNKFNDSTELRVVGAVGQDYIDFSLGSDYLKLTTTPLSSRIELSQKLAQGITDNVGVDILYTPYDVDVRFPPPARPGEPPGGPFLSRPAIETHAKDTVVQPGFYNELELTPWRGTRIVPGGRLDYSKNTGSWDVSPRVVARQEVVHEFPKTTLKGGAGVFHQPPQPQETDPVFGMTGLRSNRAIQYDVGVEQEITRPVEISIDAYYKQLDYLVIQGLGNTGTGDAYGIETLIRWKPDKRFFGWLAYTLGRSERRDAPGEPIHLIQYDQTHILTVLGSYRLGHGFEFGARFRLVSGNLYTPRIGSLFDENVSAYLPVQSYPPYNTRLPYFHQLDIRVDKSWVAPNFKFSVYADVQNVYNNANPEGISYNFNSSQHVYASGIPLLPSIGVRGEL